MPRIVASTHHPYAILLAVVLAVGGALVGASTAAAGDTRCGVAQEFPTPDIAISGTFDNVVVTEGLTCVLLFAEVRGNVVALPGSKIFIVFSEVHGNVEAKAGTLANSFFDVSIGGNYACDGCRVLEATDVQIGGNVDVVGLRPFGTSDQGFGTFIGGGSEVGGNVTIRDSQGEAGILNDFEVSDTTIGGNLTFANNLVDGVAAIERNIVGGDVAVLKNRGSINIADNDIEASLECLENDPAPASAGNDARQFKGQCQA